MGLIKTTEQNNGSYLLEITYGGAEAPFGGIDTSAPPAYIDPKCFVASDGLLVVDNKLVTISLAPMLNPPILFGGVTDVNLLGAGTFYNSDLKQLNYVLGYTVSSVDPPAMPSFVDYMFYITSWDPSDTSTVNTDTLNISLFDSISPSLAASLTLDVIQSQQPVGFTDGITGTITAVNGTGGITGFTLVSGGTGWTVGTEAVIDQVGNPAGIGAIFTATAVSSGVVTGFTISPVGTGYDTTTGGGAAATPPSITQLTINGIPEGVPAFLGATYQTIVADMIAVINADPATLVTASASLDGLQLILTALTPGSAGNSITVQDTSTNGAVNLPPAFYFSNRITRTLQGGTDQTILEAPRSFGPSSITSVGGTLYIGNTGPFILQYKGPGTFTTLTMYTGVNVLRKFAGALVGLGVDPQVGVFTADTDMIFVWSASEELSEWSPVTVTGDVTGAGFAQLADISDALTGLIISNNTAFIIRQQGITYATPTDNGTDPYSFAHISLGDSGEGGQVPALVCQYDQMGAYVGNSNVHSVSQSTSPIGEKIKNAIFAFLSALPDPIPNNPLTNFQYLMSSAGTNLFIGGTDSVFFVFNLGTDVYFFNATNGIWMHLGYTVTAPNYPQQGLLATFSNSSLMTSDQSFKQNQLALVQNVLDNTTGVSTVQIFDFQEGLSTDAISNTCLITFPVEEILFDRFINIDSLVIALFTPVLSGFETITFEFIINEQTFSTLVFDAATNNSNPNPTEYQVFPTANGSGIAVSFSAVDPQLAISITTGLTSFIPSQITKIAMFGSFDPNQRPV